MTVLSTFTGIQPYLIAERSEATPGLFNNLVSVVSQNLDQLNTDTAALSAAQPPGALNAASLPGSGVSQIQAAINKAAALAIPIVYLPTNLLPYDASSISFIHTVRMVREGGNWTEYDVQAYGATTDAVTDTVYSFRGALAAAAAAAGLPTGATGTVYVPTGNYSLSSQLVLPDKVRMVGVGRSASLLKFTGAPTTGCVRLGDGSSLVFGCRIENLTVDCNNVASSIGVYSTDANEQSGVFYCVVTNFRKYGVKYLTNTGDSRIVECELYASPSGASAGVYYNGVATLGNTIQRLTITGQNGAGLTDGILVDTTAPSLLIEGFHAENCTHGIHFTKGNGVILDAVGDPSTTNLLTIEATASSGIVGFGLYGNGSPTVVNDVKNSKTITSAIGDVGWYCLGAASGSLLAADTVTSVLSNGLQLKGNLGIGTVPVSNMAAVVSGTLPSSANQAFGLVVSGAGDSAATSGVFGAQFRGNIPSVATTFAQSVCAELSTSTKGAGATVTAAYGLLVDDVGIGTTNFAIYTGNGFVRFGGQVLNGVGTATAPAMAYSSETSLGWYRSASSEMGLSYGDIRIPAPGRIYNLSSTQYWYNNTPAVAAAVGTWDSASASVATDLMFNLFQGSAWTQGARLVNATRQFEVPSGSAIAPTLAYSSESSLGWYRSGTSILALSYGTLDLTSGGAVLSIASLRVKSGTNNSCGTAVLGSNGSVNVANTYVKTGDLIFLTDQTPGGTIGDIELGGIRDSSGFTIQSTSVTDTSTVAWLIVRPT